jgi:hypothetical protein
MLIGFVLEVLKYYPNVEDKIRLNGMYEHVGYMDAVFKSKKEAAEYYNMYNDHMRKLDSHKTWCSDYDPNTYLLYIVREYYGQSKLIPPFNEK